ncbi:hypothetical protein B0H17DRAFT_1204331 [Mycena rosella]|uniref:Uncharacterized protein n=1 Tax=Mycena rosella TaxID=1033263 RepID=A0AAD7D9Y9_MYCRO|nr:hypothetical protein B0H17DRAFT_1204331 [Mycena rosella]
MRAGPTFLASVRRLAESHRTLRRGSSWRRNGVRAAGGEEKRTLRRDIKACGLLAGAGEHVARALVVTDLARRRADADADKPLLFASSTHNAQPDQDQEDVVWHESEAYSAVISYRENPRDVTSLLSLYEVLRQKAPLDGASSVPSSSRFGKSGRLPRLLCLPNNTALPPQCVRCTSYAPAHLDDEDDVDPDAKPSPMNQQPTPTSGPASLNNSTRGAQQDKGEDPQTYSHLRPPRTLPHIPLRPFADSDGAQRRSPSDNYAARRICPSFEETPDYDLLWEFLRRWEEVGGQERRHASQAGNLVPPSSALVHRSSKQRKIPNVLTPGLRGGVAQHLNAGTGGFDYARDGTSTVGTALSAISNVRAFGSDVGVSRGGDFNGQDDERPKPTLLRVLTCRC